MIKNLFSFLNCCSNVGDFSEEDFDKTKSNNINNFEIVELKDDPIDKLENSTAENLEVEDRFFTKNIENDYDLDDILFEDKYIRDDEKDIIFTKRGLIKFIEKLMSFEYEEFYNKDDLTLSRRDTSPINSNFQLGKYDYKLKKDKFKNSISLNEFGDISKPEIRKKWDTSVKVIERTYVSDFSYVQYTHYVSPVFFISERDVMEKRAEFTYKNIYYNVATSIDDQFQTVNEKIVRCLTYMNIYIITQDDEYFYFRGFGQLDTKMILPESFFNLILPIKLFAFYKKLIEVMNKS